MSIEAPVAATRPRNAPGPLARSLAPSGERVRHPGDLARLLLSAAVLLVVVVAGVVIGDRVLGDRSAMVRALDARSTTGHALIIGVQLLTTLGAASLAVALLWQHRYRVILTTTITGLAAGALYLGLRDLAGGSAPAAQVASLQTGGLVASAHYPSGPWIAAAIAVAVAAEPWLRLPWRRTTFVIIVGIALGRVLVGTLLPIELVLAATVGVATAAAALLAVGAPDRRLDDAAVQEALETAGLAVAAVVAAPHPGRGARAFVAERPDGSRLFLKVLGRDERDADLLYRGYRFLRLRSVDDVRPAASLRQAVEHQALVGLVAEQAGANVPHVERVIATEDGSAILAMQHVEAQPLSTLDGDAVDADTLRRLWKDVARLHDAGIAHRSLRTGNVLVDAEGVPWIVDFSFSELSATRRHRELDCAELLSSLSALVGPSRAVHAAVAELGREAVSSAVRYVQPLALSAATRQAVGGQDDLLARTRAAVAVATDEPVVELERLQRVRVQTLLMIGVLAGAFYLLLPQMAQVGSASEAFLSADPRWIAVVVVLSALTYVGAAIGTMGSIPQHVRLVPCTLVQVAASFVNRVTPASIGGMVLNGRFLEKSGADRGTAVAAIGLNSLAGGLVHVVMIVGFFVWSRSQLGKAFSLPSTSKLLIAVPIVLAVVGLVLWSRWGRRRLLRPLLGGVRSAFASLKELAQNPAKLSMLFGGSVLVTMAYILAFHVSIVAVGGDIGLAQSGTVFLAASALAAPSPTPGNLGALEAALIAALTGVGVSGPVAVSSVLAYRLATYWLPVLPGWLFWHMIQRRGYV